MNGRFALFVGSTILTLSSAFGSHSESRDHERTLLERLRASAEPESNQSSRLIKLNNPQFEDQAKLMPGQEQVGLGNLKFILLDANDPNFSRSIAGIPGWQIATPELGGRHADIGLACPTWSSPQGNRWLFCNRWNHVAWQQTDEVIKPGVTYTLTVDVSLARGSLRDDKAGTIQLIAGGLLPGSASELSEGSVIVGQKTVATPAWDGPADLLFESLELNEVQKIKVSFKVSKQSAASRKKLSIAVFTNEKSVGSTYWDNFRLEASP